MSCAIGSPSATIISIVENLSSQDIRVSNQSQEELIAELTLEIRRHQNAQDLFDELVAERLGINRSDQRCLDIVDQHGRISAGELARESGLSTGAITTLLDRLERAGYVRRIRDTDDRRRVLVELTDLARERAEEIWGPIAASATRGLAVYSDAELRLIRDFLRGGRDFLAAHTERVKALPPLQE
jgi:DNA-binding MarR family transcriptional regulator